MSGAIEAFRFRATISQLTSGDRCAIVELDEPVDGIKLAVIDGDTKGRLALKSQDGMRLGTKVQCETSHKGPDSFLVSDVTLVP